MTNEKKLGNKRKSIYFDFNFICILIFLLFRIPLTNIIGNEGNGYFSITWELYTIFGLLFGLSLSNVTCEMIRKRFRRNHYKNAAALLTTALICGLLTSLLGAAVIYFISDFLLGMISMKLSGIGFRLIAFLLILSTITGIFRGFFEGTGTNVPTAFSKIVEAFVAGTGAVIFTLIFTKYGAKVGALLFNPQYTPAFGATGMITGCIFGSIFSLIFLIIVNHIYQAPLKQLFKREADHNPESLKTVFSEMIKLFLITFTELVFFKVFRIVNMWIYIKTTSVTNAKDKIVQYLGSYHGKVLVLTGISVIIVLSFSGRNLKRIHKLYSKSNYALCWKYFCEDIKQNIYIALPFVALYSVLAKNIFMILFKTAGNIEVIMLQISSINAILISVAIYIYRLLRKMDMRLVLIIIPAVAFVLQTVIMQSITKIPTLGALSMIISETAFWLFIVIMELIIAVKSLKQGFKSTI